MSKGIAAVGVSTRRGQVHTTETDEYEFHLSCTVAGEFYVSAYQRTKMHLCEEGFLLRFTGQREVGTKLVFVGGRHPDDENIDYLLEWVEILAPYEDPDDEPYEDLDEWLTNFGEEMKDSPMPQILKNWVAELPTYEIEVVQGWEGRPS